MIIQLKRISGWKAALLIRSRIQLRACNEAVADRKREKKTCEYCDNFPKRLHEPYAVYEMPLQREVLRWKNSQRRPEMF